MNTDICHVLSVFGFFSCVWSLFPGLPQLVDWFFPLVPCFTPYYPHCHLSTDASGRNQLYPGKIHGLCSIRWVFSRENNKGHKTEPWGTPYFTILGSDKCSITQKSDRNRKNLTQASSQISNQFSRHTEEGYDLYSQTFLSVYKFLTLYNFIHIIKIKQERTDGWMIKKQTNPQNSFCSNKGRSEYSI